MSVFLLDGAQIGQHPVFILRFWLEPLIFHRYILLQPILEFVLCVNISKLYDWIYTNLWDSVQYVTLAFLRSDFSTLKALEAMLENHLSSVYFFISACAGRTHDFYECESPHL